MSSYRFIRVIYDARRKFPWVVVWGSGRIWCSFGSQNAALDEAARLREVCDNKVERTTQDTE